MLKVSMSRAGDNSSCQPGKQLLDSITCSGAGATLFPVADWLQKVRESCTGARRFAAPERENDGP